MLAQYILIPASFLISFASALPVADKSTNGNSVCVASTLNPGSCDDGSFDDTTLNLDPTLDVDPSILRRGDNWETLDDSDDSDDSDDETTDDNNICVASTANPGSCDSGDFDGSTIDVDPTLDIDPTILRRGDTWGTLDDSDDSDDETTDDNNICVASTDNPGSCDSGDFDDSTVNYDPTLKVDPTVANILRRGDSTFDDNTICVASTDNPGSCDDGDFDDSDLNVAPKLDLSPSVL